MKDHRRKMMESEGGREVAVRVGGEGGEGGGERWWSDGGRRGARGGGDGGKEGAVSEGGVTSIAEMFGAVPSSF